MDNKKKLLAGSAMVALSALAAPGAMADTATLNMNAQIIEAVAVNEVSALNFGVLTVATATAGKVTINPVGADTVSGGVTSISAGAAGVIKITGDDGRTVDVSLPASALVTISGGGPTDMSVTGFNILTDTGGNSKTLPITGGDRNVPIGATLNVDAGQAVGTYTGTVTVTVSYN